MKKKLDLKLYLVTDSTYHTEESFLWTIEESIKGGVSIVQIREKKKNDDEYAILAKKVKNITDKYSVPLIVDDNVEVAKRVDSAGVHLGQSDMSVKEARKILGDKKIIGATAKTLEQAEKAYLEGADYLGTGAIFPTTTKVKTVITKISTLKDICDKVDIPVVAIGGLNEENTDVLKGVDIAGVCVVSAIMKSKNPKESAKRLIKSIENIVPNVF